MYGYNRYTISGLAFKNAFRSFHSNLFCRSIQHFGVVDHIICYKLFEKFQILKLNQMHNSLILKSN